MKPAAASASGRHPLAVRLAHWGVAISTVMLLVTGAGQLTFWGTYGVYSLPGLGWVEDDGISVAVHYGFALVMLMGAAAAWRFARQDRRYGLWPRSGDGAMAMAYFRSLLMGGTPPGDEEVFLPSQRLAFGVLMVLLGALTLTGGIKMIRHALEGWFPPEVLYGVTLIHNYSALLVVLWVLSHLAFLLHPWNRARLRRMV